MIGSIAADFELKDATGKLVKISEFTGKKNLLLVFNRGFA
jgi:peroxiredoxin